GGAARGDAGVPGHRRRGALRSRAAVPGDRHPEPHRPRGHLSAAGGPARPVHAAGERGLSDARRGARDPGAAGKAGLGRRAAGVEGVPGSGGGGPARSGADARDRPVVRRFVSPAGLSALALIAAALLLGLASGRAELFIVSVPLTLRLLAGARPIAPPRYTL